MPRAVTLVVEDGTIVAGANSFVTEQEIVDFALARGVTLPFTSDADKDAVAVLGIKAADYLRIMPWKGELVSATQPMPWPRQYISAPAFPNNAVPPSVKEAQLQLSLLVNNGVELIPTSTGAGYLVKEKIGPIENVYSEKVGVSTDGMPILPGIKGLLDPWLLGDMTGIVPVLIMSLGDGPHGCS